MSQRDTARKIQHQRLALDDIDDMSDDQTSDWSRGVVATGGGHSSLGLILPHGICSIEQVSSGDSLSMRFDSDSGLLVVDIRGDTLDE